MSSEFRVSSLSEALRKENVFIFLASCVELLISTKEMNTSLLVRDSATNKDVFISYVEKVIINLYCFHYHGLGATHTFLHRPVRVHSLS